jgi:hypothetical protein
LAALSQPGTPPRKAGHSSIARCGQCRVKLAWTMANVRPGLLVTGATACQVTGGGLYWLIPAAVASLAGGVVNAWLFLVRVTSSIAS